jgi:hypothetical protein
VLGEADALVRLLMGALKDESRKGR